MGIDDYTDRRTDLTVGSSGRIDDSNVVHGAVNELVALVRSGRLTAPELEELIRDTVAVFLQEGTNITLVNSDAGDSLTINAAGGGGGGATIVGYDAFVYRSGGNTIAVNRTGAVIQSLATSAANNVTVIQSAIDAVAGAYTPGTLSTLGHGGGGTVGFAGQLFEVNDTIDVKYGVSLVGESSLDRYGFVASAHSFQGTCFAPTSGLGTMDISVPGGSAVSRRPVILLGRTQDSGSSQSQTNPHGTHIRGIGIDMRRITTAQGIVIADTQFVTISECQIGNARGTGGVAIEVISTISPDDGAHGTDIRGCLLVNCEKGIAANGAGSTDSLISDCRILQMTFRTIELGVTSGGGGGWQIEHCHLTTGSTDQDQAGGAHIYLSGAPTTISGNYIDTTGGHAIFSESPMCAITGNYIKMSSAKLAPIYLEGTGRKTVVVGNTCQASSTGRAMVQVSSTSGQDFRPVVTGNIFGDGGNNAIVGIVCDDAGNAVAESNAAMTVARNGSPNPYIWGNRIVQSAV